MNRCWIQVLACFLFFMNLFFFVFFVFFGWPMKETSKYFRFVSYAFHLVHTVTVLWKKGFAFYHTVSNCKIDKFIKLFTKWKRNQTKWKVEFRISTNKDTLSKFKFDFLQLLSLQVMKTCRDFMILLPVYRVTELSRQYLMIYTTKLVRVLE